MSKRRSSKAGAGPLAEEKRSEKLRKMWNICNMHTEKYIDLYYHILKDSDCDDLNLVISVGSLTAADQSSEPRS